jgi:hypothetical protein
MILMALTMTGVWCYLYQIGLPNRYRKTGLVLTTLCPLFPMYALCMLKDSAFAIYCVIVTLLLCELVRTKGAVLKKKSFCIGLFFANLMLMFTRSQGVYILCVVVVIALIIYRKFWKQVIAAMLVPVLLFQLVWIQILLPAMNVAPGGKQEALGVLFQQTARYMNEYPDEVTEEEKEAIGKILDYDLIQKRYDPELADGVKFTFNQDSTSEDMKAYLSVWFKMFWKHPGCYVQAVLNNCYAFFYISRSSTMYYDSYFNKTKAYWTDEGLYVENSNMTVETDHTSAAIEALYRWFPFTGTLANTGIYSWIVLFFCIMMIRKKQYGFLFAGLIAILSVGILLIAPANGNARYIMPLSCLTPLMAGLCLLKSEKQKIAESTL